MAVVVAWHAQLAALKAFLDLGVYTMGLFKNDIRPTPGHSLAQFVEADFSGYEGAKPIENWTEPSMVDGRALSRGDTLTWQHSGGPIDNFIYGYFVTDEEGLLVFAERNPAGPRIVSALARDYVVEPVLTETSEF